MRACFPTMPMHGRAHAWMFAALTTVQAPIVEREAAILIERDKPWHQERLPMLDQRVRTRLEELSARLGEADWLDGDFSAGDLLMINVLRRPACAPFLDDYPGLAAYVKRGKSRRLPARIRRSTGSVQRIASGGTSHKLSLGVERKILGAQRRALPQSACSRMEA